MKRRAYASDISREKFAEIEPLLRSVRRRTKPTTVDLHKVFCAVLYLLRTGCQWSDLRTPASSASQFAQPTHS
jgi:transposase